MSVTGLLSVSVLALGGCDLMEQARNGGPAGGPGGGPPGMMAGGPSGGMDQRQIPVAAEIASPGELQVMIRGSANLRAREQVEVLPKQGGIVASVRVEEGARVSAGQVLATLDDEQWTLQARQSEARAQAALDVAERARALQAQGLMADQEVERLSSDAEVAAADLELARLTVRNASIVSPIGGTVTHRYVEQGQLVTSNTPAFAVADLDRLELQVAVPEREAVRVEEGQPARLRIQEATGDITAQVVRIRPVVDPQSGTVQVTVEVEADRDSRLRPGQFVNVDIVTETLSDRITVPRTAVLVDGAAPRIYLVRGGQAQEQVVTLGLSQGDRVEIVEGLAAGDTVVVVGQANLRNLAPVRLMELNGEPIPEELQVTAPERAPAGPAGVQGPGGRERPAGQAQSRQGGRARQGNDGL